MDLFIFFPFCVSLCVMYICICVSLYMWQHRYVHKSAYVCMCVETPVAARCLSSLFSTLYVESGLLTELGACHSSESG